MEIQKNILKKCYNYCQPDIWTVNYHKEGIRCYQGKTLMLRGVRQ